MKKLRFLILAGVPVIAALFSVVMGKDTNWDFLNYRWYVPYSLLHGRLLTDVLVAEHATFYNPLLELPFYLAATHLPSIVAGFLVALSATIGFVPLCLLAEQTIKIDHRRKRFLYSAAIALCGLLGGGVLGQIGVVSWDLPLGTLILLSLYILLYNNGFALAEEAKRLLLLAGFLSGLAAGLKLTAAVFPLGMIAAILLASRGGIGARIWRALLFSIGGAIGMALTGGYWMWRLNEAFGNPVFPYFNDLFHSAYAVEGSNRDGTFLPHGMIDTLGFPFLFSANSLRVAEYHFRDVHIALAYFFIIFAIVIKIINRRGPENFTIRPAAWFLFIFAAVSFGAWEQMFAIYRYILPLEMLAPLLIVLAIGCLRMPDDISANTIMVVLIAAQCLISVGWNRRSWDGDYVDVKLPYAIPADATILMTGGAPMGYVVTSLPDNVPVLRAGSYLASGNRFADILANRIAGAQGPLLALFAPGDEAATVDTLTHYGLIGVYTKCDHVTSNASDPLWLCPVRRK